MADYQVNLNLLDAPNDTAPVEAGSISPINPAIQAPETSPGALDILGAIGMGSVPARIGKQSAYYVDKIHRSLNSQDNGQEVDPQFNAFKTWKDGGHSINDLNDIMDMKNYDEYAVWQEFQADKQRNAEIINNSGVTGKTANFIFDLATDPTMYAGFGVAKMINAGLSKSAAFAIGGAAAGATSEGISAYAGDKHSAGEIGFNLAASAALGGLLGKGLDAWEGLAAKKLLKEPDFHKASANVIREANAYDPEAPVDFESTVGAMQNTADAGTPDHGLGGSVIGRAFGKFISKANISPKLRLQTASQPETVELGMKILGQNQLSAANETGVATGANILEETQLLKGKNDGSVIDYVGRMNEHKKSGHVLDDAGEARALLLAQDSKRVLTDAETKAEFNPAEIETAAFHRDRAFTWAELSKKIDGFYSRLDYGAPLRIMKEKVNANFDGFVEKMVEVANKQKKYAGKAVKKLDTKIAALEQQIAKLSENNGVVHNSLTDALKELKDQHVHLSNLSVATDAEILNDAKTAATHFATGNFDSLPNRDIDKLLPRSFRTRSMNPKDFIEFMQTDPVKLWSGYADDVAPFVASHNVLGHTDISEAVKSYQSTMMEKIGEAVKSKDKALENKLTEEMKGAISRVNTAWEMNTMEFSAKEYKANPSLYKASHAIANVVRPTMLGGQVLASANELSAVTLFHGLADGGRFLRVLTNIAASPEFRAMSIKQARSMGIGLEAAKNMAINSNFIEDLQRAGLTDKVSMTLSEFSRRMARYNGSVFYDSIVRTAMTTVHNMTLQDGLERLLSGQISKHEAEDLAFLGFNKGHATKILSQIKQHGTEVNGVLFANSSEWANKEMAGVWERALHRDLSRTSLIPGIGDTPFALKTPMGQVLGMFRSWSLTATQKYLLSTLQRKDAGALMGVSMMVGVGSLLDLAYSKAQDMASGNDSKMSIYQKNGELDAASVLWAGINRSGIVGILPEAGGSYFMNKAFDIKSGGAKMYDYQNAAGIFAGPTGSYVDNAMKLGEKAVKGKDGWQNNLINILPIPIVKPMIKSLVEGNQ